MSRGIPGFRRLRILLYRLLGLVVITALLVGATLLSALYHFTLPSARRTAAVTTSTLVSSLIEGELRIGNIQEMTPERVVAGNVEFFDPNGTRVIIAERVELGLDLDAAMDGVLRFSYAHLTHGTIRLIEGESGLPTMIEGFLPSTPPTGEGESLEAIVDDMILTDLTVHGELFGLRGIRVENVTAEGRLHAEGDLEIQIARVVGQMVAPFDFIGHIDDLAGTIHTDPTEGVRLEGHGRVEREDGPTDRIRLQLTYARPASAEESAPSRLNLRVDADQAEVAILSELGYAWAEPLIGGMQGYVWLYGPVDDLNLRVWADTDGGPVAVEGSIPAGGVVVMEARSPGLDIGRVVRDMPSLIVDGRGRITIDTTNPNAPPRFVITGEPFAFAEYALPSFEARGALIEDGIQLDRLTAPYAGGDMTADGSIGFDGAIDLRVRGHIPQIADDPNIHALVPNARGRVQGDVRITRAAAPGSFLSVDGTAELSAFRYGNMAAARLSVRGQFSGDPTQPSVDLHAAGSGVRVSGYDLGTGELTVSGGPRNYQVDGDFRASDRRIAATGTVRAESGEYTADVSNLRLGLGGTEWNGTADSIRIRPDGSITVGAVTVSSGNQRVTLRGNYGTRTGDDLVLNLVGFDLRTLPQLVGPGIVNPNDNIGGWFTGRVQLGGNSRDPRLRIEGTVNDGTFRDVTGIDAFFAGNYGDGNLDGDLQLDLGDRGSLTFSGDGLVARGVATVGEALEGGVYNTRTHLTDLDLGVLRGILQLDSIPVTGHADGQVDISGPVFAPTIRARVRSPDLGYADWPALQTGVSLDYDSGVLNARVTTEDAFGELMEVEGNLLIDLVQLFENTEATISSMDTLPWQLSLRSPNRLVEDLPAPIKALLPTDLYPLRLSLSGTLSGGSVATRGELFLNGQWTGDSLDETFCQQRLNPRVEMRANLEDGVTTADIKLFAGATRFMDARVTAPTPVDGWVRDATLPDVPPPTQIRGTIENVPLNRLPYACQLGRARVSAAFQADRLFTTDPEARVELHSPSLVVAGGTPARVSATMSVNADSGRLVAEIDWWGGKRAQITGEVPLVWQAFPPIPAIAEDEAVTLVAAFEEAPIAPFLSLAQQVENPEGTIDGEVRFEGPIRRLRSSGEVEIHDGYLELPDLGQHLNDVSGRISFHGNWARLHQVTARDGNGTVVVDGSVGFDGYRPARTSVNVRASNFPVRREGSTLASLTGNAGIEGTFGEEQADLDVSVREMSILLPDRSPTSVQSLEPHPDIVLMGQERAAPRSEDVYPLHLSLVTVEPFYVGRADLGARVAADLDVTYRDPHLLVGGYVDLRGGFYEVFGKRFELDRGTMNFDGGTEMNPVLNMIATHEMRSPANTTVVATITGTLSAPEIVFSSNHATCTESSAVISMLLSNRCTGSGTGASTQEAEQQTAEFLQGVGMGVLSLTARQELGSYLPVIRIESGSGTRSQLVVGRSANEIIPEFMRGIVQGAYIEGIASLENEDSGTETDTSSTQPFGFRVELQFPYNLVTTGELQPPADWSFDLTWEP